MYSGICVRMAQDLGLAAVVDGPGRRTAAEIDDANSMAAQQKAGLTFWVSELDLEGSEFTSFGN